MKIFILLTYRVWHTPSRSCLAMPHNWICGRVSPIFRQFLGGRALEHRDCVPFHREHTTVPRWMFRILRRTNSTRVRQFPDQSCSFSGRWSTSPAWNRPSVGPNAGVTCDSVPPDCGTICRQPGSESFNEKRNILLETLKEEEKHCIRKCSETYGIGIKSASHLGRRGISMNLTANIFDGCKILSLISMNSLLCCVSKALASRLYEHLITFSTANILHSCKCTTTNNNITIFVRCQLQSVNERDLLLLRRNHGWLNAIECICLSFHMCAPFLGKLIWSVDTWWRWTWVSWWFRSIQSIRMVLLPWPLWTPAPVHSFRVSIHRLFAKRDFALAADRNVSPNAYHWEQICWIPWSTHLWWALRSEPPRPDWIVCSIRNMAHH